MSLRNSCSESVETSRATGASSGLLFGLDGDDLDLQLLERVVEVVDLARVEVELVERERDLVRSHRSGLLGALEQPLGLVGFENVRYPFRATSPYDPCAQLGLPSLSCAAD